MVLLKPFTTSIPPLPPSLHVDTAPGILSLDQSARSFGGPCSRGINLTAGQSKFAMISDRNTARGVRKYGRVTVDANVRVLHAQGATTARTCDIGCGGMSFLAPLELAEGKIVHLEFQLPYSNSPFRVMAVVKNRNGLRYGVEFQELTPDQFGEIARVTAILSFSQA